MLIISLLTLQIQPKKQIRLDLHLVFPVFIFYLAQ